MPREGERHSYTLTAALELFLPLSAQSLPRLLERPKKYTTYPSWQKECNRDMERRDLAYADA